MSNLLLQWTRQERSLLMPPEFGMRLSQQGWGCVGEAWALWDLWATHVWVTLEADKLHLVHSWWDAATHHLQDVPLAIEILTGETFTGGRGICSLLKYPLSTEFDVPFAGMSPPCPLKVAQHSWPGVQQVLGGPGSVWGWSPALRPHKPSPSPATEWKIPAFQAYVIWEEVNGSAIYIHLFGDFAAAFALQSPCGVEKELN